MKENIKKLVIGHAGKKIKDAITLDVDPEHNPDVIHDLNKTPWPFKDNQFNEVIAHHVLEHLNDIIPVMEELHRICSKDGTIYIEVPHHSSFMAHVPFHKLFFNSHSFDIWYEDRHTWTTGFRFHLIKKEITFHVCFRRYFLHKLFNKYPKTYEKFWTYIFPAEHMKFWLQPLK